MFESITISFEGIAALSEETQAERDLRKDRHSYQKPEQHRNRQNDPGKPRYRQTAELLRA